MKETLLGVMDYKTRFYSPYLNRFSQPDTIVPVATQGMQAYNRYSYANNNPIKNNDPTGHYVPPDVCAMAGGSIPECKSQGGTLHKDPYTNKGPYDKYAPVKKDPNTILVCGWGSGIDCDNSYGNYDNLPLAPYYDLSDIEPSIWQAYYGGGADGKVNIAWEIYNLIKDNPDGRYNLVGHSAGGSAVILAVYLLQRDGYGDQINNVVLLDPAFETITHESIGTVNLLEAANSINPNKIPDGIRVFLGDVVEGDGDDFITGAYEYQTNEWLDYEVDHLQLATNMDIYDLIVNSKHWRR